MTMTEKKIASVHKELDKYNTQLARRKAILEKKTQACIKLDCNWSKDEFFSHRETCTDKQYSAWFDLGIAQDAVKEAEDHIANATKRLNKLMPQMETISAQTQEDDRIETMKDGFEKTLKTGMVISEEEYKKWFQWFRNECLKDGIILDLYGNNRIDGHLKNGKQFSLLINDGYTKRSFHCYTLYIDGECIFTSGLFETAYNILKN